MAILYSDPALSHLDEIYYYIAVTNQSPENATRFMQRLDEAISQLELFPEMGRARDDWEPGIRLFVYKGYAVLYRILEERDVLIEAVLEGHQDIEGRFGE